ncbi:MAG: UDP-N-acetylmuramoyl-L-alanyl-D-glutamate--2,6-diaminopimelate ligase [Methylophilaceae bacterium]|jgi:UDP-N-acetylmuramoyl-L-alanyl-D-glutamate--2,6-diaminopimelate ligase|uniref:UDP-N-acetylmuramoyl-L-alanyl-D-glutamate--2, 6-diaminopimelate ligase n=1 Tax=Methylobacillus sp. MM3 TaxID=1848039 RepID=UPI0007E1A8A0|nr:UDP-N-acetylmuramoyl-L-alanyl-D-glutamate--2,6-diaminopimelate ligase [Methylobacillus sp. MM3]OAJ70376.1 UDP-N-acetylmuramoyl-L-alanyl-D-glutamate--2,6-diaminopimelate ligase [Methylobacillus sp. MM3]
MTSLLSQLGVKATQLTTDSRKAGPGSIFLAYPGESADGRKYIPQAVARGAAGILWEHEGFEWESEWSIPNLPVANLRAQAGVIADEFHGHPSRKLRMIGITGTNGKTSCSHWLAEALTRLGRKTAAIGTLGNGFPGELSEAINTTPDPVLLHGMLAEYVTKGAAGAAMEVSSHGLAQGRVNGVHFDVAVLTNLSRDHLDYHGDMAAYAEAKKKLFYWPDLGCMVLNTDDDFGAEFADDAEGRDLRVLTYGLQTGDVRGQNLELHGDGLAMDVVTPSGNARLEVRLMGRFNAYNLLAVLAVLLASDVPLHEAVAALKDVKPVAGRMQTLGGGEKPLVVIDYAHTPDALEKVLVALREQTAGRLICVFGCGGNRDKGKRPLMGEAASRLADKVIVTSDNPRHEDPASIINEVIAGMSGDYHVEADRAAAIDRAIGDARPGDVVLIAGKGHEDYQDIGGIKLPFDDREVARRMLECRP